MPKAKNNLAVLESGRACINEKIHAVLSSAIIVYVLVKYDACFQVDQYEILLKCLRFPAEKEVFFGFVETIFAFDKQFLR